MTATAEQAESLHTDVGKSGLVFAVAHCYTGYPMVREARELVAAGAVGEVRMVEAEHAAGGPDMVREPADKSTRHWRFRESSMGKASVLGEVGSHPHNIAEYVSGRRVTSVSAALRTLAAEREVYDNAYLTVEYEGGATKAASSGGRRTRSTCGCFALVSPLGGSVAGWSAPAPPHARPRASPPVTPRAT
jgi:predicted dehydrogenase